MKTFIISWFITGVVMHFLCYLSWKLLTKTPDAYQRYLKDINKGKLIHEWNDPMNDTSIVFISLVGYTIMGYISIFYTLRFLFKR